MTLRAGKHSATAYQVPRQFPSVFREEGPSFVEFVRSFYEWMDTEGPGAKTRILPEYDDVDSTPDDAVSHFVKKYLHGLPSERFADKRFVIKHVLDVYRSKGSVEGLKLLFRLVFGETPDVYVPSRDVIKPSDGVYIVPTYFEVSYSPYNPSYARSYVTGSSSGATAIVEDFVTYRVRGREVYIMYISNIVGDFSMYERILTPGVPYESTPRIVGSAVSAEVIDGISGSSLGDKFISSDTTGTGLGSAVVVNDLTDDAAGTVVFDLVSGGFGYSLSTPIVVLAGGLKDEGGATLVTESGDYIDFAPGSGASLAIGTLSNTSSFEVSFTVYAPYDGDTYSDTTFVVNPIMMSEASQLLMTEGGEFLVADAAPSGVINDELTYAEWEDADSVSVGTIASIVVNNDGAGWTSNPSVIVTNDFVASLMIADGLGGFWGDDARVDATLTRGEDFVSGVRVSDSGFGYTDGDEVTCVLGGDEITVRLTLGPVGRGVGSWRGTEGMTNADKYIHDSHYYQEFSYDVRSSMSLDAYEDILKETHHPAGSELFGTAVIGGEVSPDTTGHMEIAQT